MISNYFLLAFRSLVRQRGYALVNIFGLAVGLASAICIMMYIKDELTFDRMHAKANHIYRLGLLSRGPDGNTFGSSFTPAGWDNYIQSNYEGVGAIGGFMMRGMPTSIQNVAQDRIVLAEDKDFMWTESSLTDVLTIPIVKGAQTNPLKEVNSIMMTESQAKSIFSDEDPIGKTVLVSNMFATNRKKVEMVVTAVMKDFPSNSHFQPSFLGNILALKEFNDNLEGRLNSYMGTGNQIFYTQSFFICKDEAKVPTILADLQTKADQMTVNSQNQQYKFTPVIRRITDVHFDNEVTWWPHFSVDIKYIYVFAAIAFLILVVASINYINLATARSANRAREIGLRKTFGGVRLQLFVQFMMESFVLVLISALVAVLSIAMLMPQFNMLAGKMFTLDHLFDTEMLLVIGGVVLTVTLLAGGYPAVFVSGFKPASVLKGKFGFKKGSNVFRQVLTTVQFGAAVILLSGTFIVVNQMDLMRNSKLNEAGNQIVSIRYGGFTGPATDEQYRTYRELVLQDPQIEGVSLTAHLPRQENFGSMEIEFRFPELSDDKFSWSQINGDYYYPEMFGMKFLAGRSFDPKNTADTTAVILNEAAVRALQTTPEAIIGQEVIRPRIAPSFMPVDPGTPPVHGTVIGVVEDFPYQSMRNHQISPLALSPKPHRDNRIIYVRLSANHAPEKIADLEKKWKQIFPEYGFDYWFIDSEFARLYENEVRLAALVEKFSWLAMFVACVGLYGLASFMAEQRTREIGIRKTMGASNRQILVLLLKVFGRLLVVGSIIGVPVAYLISQNWLENFVYRTPLSVVVFGTSLMLIAGITLLTVGYETMKAAMANPIKAIRHE